MNPGRHHSSSFALRRPGGPLASLRKMWAVLGTTLASRFAYLGEMLVRTTFLVLILFTFTQLWRATNRGQDVLAQTGFSVAMLIWYLAFTEAIITSMRAANDLVVDQEVRSGDLAYRLARPLAYPLYHLGADLGDRFLRFGLNLAVGCTVALIVVGPIRLAPLSVAAALLATVLAFLADWVWTFTISLLSFWVENTQGLHFLYRRCLMLLGGMLIPLEAYPKLFERVVRALPFQQLIYQPARLFVQSDTSGLLAVVRAQLWILAIGLGALLFLYHLGLRRVSAQGG